MQADILCVCIFPQVTIVAAPSGSPKRGGPGPMGTAALTSCKDKDKDMNQDSSTWTEKPEMYFCFLWEFGPVLWTEVWISCSLLGRDRENFPHHVGATCLQWEKRMFFRVGIGGGGRGCGERGMPFLPPPTHFCCQDYPLPIFIEGTEPMVGWAGSAHKLPCHEDTGERREKHSVKS